MIEDRSYTFKEFTEQAGTIRTRPGHVSADNVWETVTMLQSKIEQGMDKDRAIRRLQTTIKLYCLGVTAKDVVGLETQDE